MPLTFAHPAAVLPFPRKSQYFNFTALVLGSMAPDFEYFLRGQPSGMIGHTLPGFVYLNLPLVIIFYFIYHKFVHQTLFRHLPYFLQDSNKSKLNLGKKIKIIVFVYSAFIGMFTHIIWDSFTHEHGFMVLKIPILTNRLILFGFEIPIYKLLQHGSTLFGIAVIIGYLSYRAIYLRSYEDINLQSKQKIYYWLIIFILSCLVITLWYTIDFMPIRAYGVAVVRIFDSMLISIFIVTIFYKYRDSFVT